MTVVTSKSTITAGHTICKEVTFSPLKNSTYLEEFNENCKEILHDLKILVTQQPTPHVFHSGGIVLTAVPTKSTITEGNTNYKEVAFTPQQSLSTWKK